MSVHFKCKICLSHIYQHRLYITMLSKSRLPPASVLIRYFSNKDSSLPKVRILEPAVEVIYIKFHSTEIVTKALIASKQPSTQNKILFSSVQFSSVTQSCSTLWDPTNHSMPGLPVYHQLLESTQTYVHWVGDAVQQSHPLSSPSPPALNPSQHKGLFKWVSSSHQVAKVLEFQLQHQSFQWTPRSDLLWDGLVESPFSPRDSQESSPTPQFKSSNSLVLSFLYSPTLTSIHDYWKKHSLD